MSGLSKTVCGAPLAELFADLGADEVEEEDEVHEALDDERELMIGIELENEEACEKNDGGKRECPGPAKEQEKTAGGGEEEGGEYEVYGSELATDNAKHIDNGQDHHVEADGSQGREREQFAARRGRRGSGRRQVGRVS